MMKTYPICVSFLLVSFLLSVRPIAIWSQENSASDWVQETENEYAHKAEIDAYNKAILEGKSQAEAKKAAEAAREQAKKDFESNKPVKDPQSGKNINKVSESKLSGNQGGGGGINPNTDTNMSKPSNDTPASNKPSSNNTSPNNNQNHNAPNTGKPITANTTNNNSSGNSENTPASGGGNSGNNGNSGSHTVNSGNNNTHSENNNSETHHDSEDNYYQSKDYTTVYYSDNQGKTMAAPLSIGMAFDPNGSSAANYTTASPSTTTTTQNQRNYSLSSSSQSQTQKSTPANAASNQSLLNSAISIAPTTIKVPAVLPSSPDTTSSISTATVTTSNSPRVITPASPSLLQSLKDQTSSLLGLKKDSTVGAKSRLQYDDSPVPKITLSVTDSKPVIVANEDDTPFKICIDGKTPLVRMKNSKPVKLDGIRQENIWKAEDGSFMFRGGKRHPVVITSPGNNVITLMQADGTPIRVRVQGFNEYGDATALCRFDDPQETEDGEGTTITVWGVDNPLAWKKASHVSKELIVCLLGVTTIALGWLAYLGFFTGRVSEKHPLLKLVSDRIYGSFEFFRRSSYKVYTKSFTPPPRRIL